MNFQKVQPLLHNRGRQKKKKKAAWHMSKSAANQNVHILVLPHGHMGCSVTAGERRAHFFFAVPRHWALSK